MTALEAEVVTAGLQAITYPVTDEAILAKREQYAALTADTPQGYEAVRLAIADCRKARVAVEARRKELKADSLEFGRRVDQQAKALTGLLEEIENPLQLLKDSVDEAKERVRLAAEQAERDRVEAEIRAKREAEEAEAKRLRDIEEARLAEERERLAAERKAFDEAQAMAAEATRIEREREESMLAAERDRLRAEQERLDAIRREQEEAARKLEKERAEAERAEAERQATIRAEEEARVRAERQRLEAEAAKRQEEIRAAEHAAQMEALKGDSTKLADLAESIEGIAIPTVKSELAQTVVEGARSALAEIAQGLREVAAE